jgi:hypothetical protein
MIKDYNLYDERHSSVNWRKVLGNYRGSYSFNQEWEITILELIANSVDAKANKIDINTKTDEYGEYSIICQDNGVGMNKKIFEEYHNLGSLTKEKSGETIGFAGIGAKLCIDLCEKIYTETSTGKETLASEWWFEKKEIEPKYIFMKPRDLLNHKTGTYVEIKNLINPPSSVQNIKELVLENYEYALGPYGNLKIFINGKEIKNIPISNNYKCHEFKRIIKSKKLEKNIVLEGKFFFVDDEYIQEFYKSRKNFISGINIVVFR